MENNEKQATMCICRSVFKSGENTTSKNNSPKRGLNLSIELKRAKILILLGNSDKPFPAWYNTNMGKACSVSKEIRT